MDFRKGRKGIWNRHKTNKNTGSGEANLLFTVSAATERQCETRVIFLVAISICQKVRF